ncbi:MAG: efflux RND transporter periplasmic adaptor subunit [Verrucomicrobiales bacterium]|nr:efflux RND transporter periplasmic adaptor subunit [Verrucomicrobiales bacterium]
MASTKPGRTRKIVIAAILLVGLAGLGTWAILRKREPVITVQTEPVTRKNLTELVVATGRIQAVTKVVINPEVSGEIVELPVREGQPVKKGDLLVRIKPDPYVASRNSADATYRSALAGVELSKAELEKAKIEFDRFEKLSRDKLISESDFLAAQTSLDVGRARHESARHQADQAKAALARAEEDLLKTTIVAPIDGTVVSLKSERGERVVGTAMMAGTEIMTVAQLSEMEARVDVGEIDVVLVKIGQKARLEVDSFRDRKFTGVVTEIANAAKTQGLNTQQEATKFEVRIRVQEKEVFRPGMSVTAEVETRYRTNVLSVPLQSVTTRLPKEAKEQLEKQKKQAKSEKDDESAEAQNEATNRRRQSKGNAPKPIEVVFAVTNGKCVMKPVTRGISDDNHVEITEGVEENLEIISGGYKAINRELEDGKAVKIDNTVKAFTRRDEEKKP